MPLTLFPSTRRPDKALFGTTRGHGLDLRREIHEFLYGTPRQQGHGYWVVLRHFDLTKPADAYNARTGDGRFYQITGEGVGGPLYKFEDLLIRTYYRDLTVSATRPRLERSSPIGLTSISHRSYFIEHTVALTQSDILYEIHYEGVEKPTNIAPPYRRTWSILEITPYRDQGGRIEFYHAICAQSTAQSEV